MIAIHPGALGDVILFGHLLAALRPGVALAAGGSKARLLAGAGVVDEAIDFDTLPMHEVFTDTSAGASRLGPMLGSCGRIVSCFVEAGTQPAARLAEICGAAELVSLPIRPPTGFDGHLTELWRGRLGLARGIQPASWTVPDAWRAEATEGLAAVGMEPAGAYAAIHPGAGGMEKCWPVGRFIELAGELRAEGLGVVFVLGPVELDRWPADRLAGLQDVGAVLTAPPLTKLAGILADAAVFVGNDSGPAHLAAALGTPTLALFGPTRAANFAPLGARVRCLSENNLRDLSTSRVAETARQLVRSP